MIKLMIIMVTISISILFLKWILIIFLIPFQCANGAYQKNKKNLLLKVLAAPYLVFEIFIMRGGWQRYMLFQVSTLPSCHFRKLIYKILGANIGPMVVFHFKTEIRSPHTLHVGKGTVIGDNALLDARYGLYIGENVNISSNVSIYTFQHDHKDSYFKTTLRSMKPVKIGNRVWLGCNVIVLPGVTIGEGAVCCAGCVVTKNVEPYAVVAGIPAKKVNERPRDLRYNFRGKSCRLY